LSSKTIAKPGYWESSIDASRVANSAPRLADLKIHDSGVYWLESQASENGRMALVYSDGHTSQIILPSPFGINSKVHEYGGASFCLTDEHVYFVNAKDQNLYRLELRNRSVACVYENKHHRFGDLTWDRTRQQIICVCEEHNEGKEPVNSIVAIDAQGTLHTLASGNDFYAYPRLNQKENKLCWIEWSHPNMP